ncbi:MAG: mechanosensitive ion channel family protein [Candidatus Saccharimonadales bacterium]
MTSSDSNRYLRDISEFINQPNALRSLLILLFSMLLAYYFSHFIAKVIIKVARLTAVKSDVEADEVKRLKLRRLETHLSVAIALVRVVIVGVVAFYVWQLVSPAANISTATIGASAFFVVIAGATLGMVLRDITAGSAMIIERWFDVGDFIRVEPFDNISGVVERITLRSTKIRSLNGEIVWLHNQYMQGVRVTPDGIRTISIDVFVNDPKAGEQLIKGVVKTIPVGVMTVTNAPKITRKEQWGTNLWLISVIAQTPPGREWLMEDYFVESLKQLDASSSKKLIVRKPLVRFADPAAERSFKRAVRLKKQL